MKNKDLAFILLLLAAVCAGCFVVSAWQSRAQTAAAFLILTAALAAAGTIFHYSEGSQEDQTTAQPTAPSYAPRYVERTRTYEEDQTSSGPSLGVQVSALTARGLEGAGRAAERGITKFLERPPFWAGVGFVILATISFFAGMTGMWTTWKAMHAAGVFALVSAGFFASAYQQWATGKEFAAKHFAIIWLCASVTCLVIGLGHAWLAYEVNNYGKAVSWGIFSALSTLSMMAAIPTALNEWATVRTFLATWLFKKGVVSWFIWLLVVVVGLFAFFGPVVLLNKAMTSLHASAGILFGVGLILLTLTGIRVIWRKL